MKKITKRFENPKDLKINELLHELIFSDTIVFQLDISDYIDDYYNYEEFMDMIRRNLRLSKVSISESKISVNSDGVIWNLKVRR